MTFVTLTFKNERVSPPTTVRMCRHRLTENTTDFGIKANLRETKQESISACGRKKEKKTNAVVKSSSKQKRDPTTSIKLIRRLA